VLDDADESSGEVTSYYCFFGQVLASSPQIGAKCGGVCAGPESAYTKGELQYAHVNSAAVQKN
jgi:hypothetical protein